jgi:hypothetical protein
MYADHVAPTQSALASIDWVVALFISDGAPRPSLLRDETR